MEIPSIFPHIAPDMMITNLPAPPSPTSTCIFSDSQAALNLYSDILKSVPRSDTIELKTTFFRTTHAENFNTMTVTK